ncbi:acyl carrier protein [Paenibacillus sp. KN14-4R]|uniref:acyl carrier protein n=1 Tax=Paenibacillus sp. KN14-4R TaxID=3445773 RepID=UPI003FA002F1
MTRSYEFHQMTLSELEQEVILLLAKVLEISPQSLNRNSSMDNTRAWDSFAITFFIIELETHFNVDLNIRDIERFNSVENTARILKENYLSGSPLYEATT